MSWAAQPPTDREALVTSPDPGVLLGPGPPDGQPRLAGGGPRGILGVPLSSRRALWRGKNTFQHLQILKMDFSQGNRDSEPAPFPEREPGKQRGSRGGGGAGASARRTRILGTDAEPERAGCKSCGPATLRDPSMGLALSGLCLSVQWGPSRPAFQGML